MKTQAELALEVIARRKWRNGYLMHLARKVLSGESIDREQDTDLTEKEWQEVNEDGA